MDTEHKGSGLHHEPSTAGKFRRYIVAPASIISTVLYVFFFIGEVREKFHHSDGPESGKPEPSLFEAMRTSVDHQLQQIRSVDAKSLGATFGDDLDSHDCNWRFQCKDRFNLKRLLPVPGQPFAAILGSNAHQPSTSIFTPPTSTIHPLTEPAHITDFSKLFDKSESSSSHTPTLEQTSRPNTTGEPAQPHLNQKQIDEILANINMQKNQSASSIPLRKELKAEPQKISQEDTDNFITQLRKNPPPADSTLQGTAQPKTTQNSPAIAVQNNSDTVTHALDDFQKNPSPYESPTAYIHFGFIFLPTFHTIFGTPRALKLTLRQIGSAGGWAIIMFLACAFLYFVIMLGLAGGRDGNPLIALTMIVASPVAIAYMVQFVQWVAGGMFYGVSWVLGEVVLLLAYAGGLSLLVALPHIYKAPREVIEAAEVIRNV
jgi:hypothetical protein